MNYSLIAEIGGNHKGDFDIAKRMVKIAAEECKVDIVKFQKRDNKLLLTEDEYNSPHPNPNNSYGKTYGEHREFLEFNIDEHIQLKSLCEKYKVIYSSSVWDINSSNEILSIKPKIIKIPSAQNTNFELLENVFKKNKEETHISLGMTTKIEIEEIVKLSKKLKQNYNTVLFHCTSDYPAQFDQLNLLEIKRLHDEYKKQIKYIGFSGHHNGISMDIAALTLGAKVIERHFTLDRTWKGTDHAASLEPTGLKKLKRDMNHLEQSLKLKQDNNSILSSEKAQYRKLKWKKKSAH